MPVHVFSRARAKDDGGTRKGEGENRDSKEGWEDLQSVRARGYTVEAPSALLRREKLPLTFQQDFSKYKVLHIAV